MQLSELHEHAANIQNAHDSICFAHLVLATIEQDITDNTRRSMQARETLCNARHLLLKKQADIEAHPDQETP